MTKLNTVDIYEFVSEIYAPTFKFQGKCQNPQFSMMMGAWTRCHKCTKCLEAKKEQWITRSIQERAKWPKAWFVTLTYEKVENYDYGNVQRYFKTVRNRRKAKGRDPRVAYLCTDEYDSSGTRDYNPHHHLAIYGDDDLTYRDLFGERADHWPYGNTDGQILKNRSASYVAKYITKDGGRIRASQNFGKHIPKYLKLTHPYTDVHTLQKKESKT